MLTFNEVFEKRYTPNCINFRPSKFGFTVINLLPEKIGSCGVVGKAFQGHS